VIEKVYALAIIVLTNYYFHHLCRIQLNAQGKAGVAKPTVGSIYADIGFAGLWAGLGTRIVMIGTLTALQWLIYDSFKVYAGLPTTGAAAPEEKPAGGAIASKLH
jgi:hypothetical protein